MAASSSKRTRRRQRMMKRSRSYWQQHDKMTFSKVIIRDVEALWLEMLGPKVSVELKMVDNPDQYPRYRSGLWDGQAYFVSFLDVEEAQQFRMKIWNNRL
jgi:hypothetical protein